MSKKIVVIDDEEILVRSFSKLLEKQGYDVFGFKKGIDAIAFSEEEDIDLIVCDLRMPGKSGVETIKDIYCHLKSVNKNVMPVLFVTGYADPVIESEARKLNPIDIVYKPFDISKLVDLVKKGVGD